MKLKLILPALFAASALLAPVHAEPPAPGGDDQPVLPKCEGPIVQAFELGADGKMIPLDPEDLKVFEKEGFEGVFPDLGKLRGFGFVQGPIMELDGEMVPVDPEDFDLDLFVDVEDLEDGEFEAKFLGKVDGKEMDLEEAEKLLKKQGVDLNALLDGLLPGLVDEIEKAEKKGAL